MKINHVILFLVTGILYASGNYALFAQEAPHEPGFIERNWWDFLILTFLIFTSLAHSDEDRGAGSKFWLFLAVLYFLYCIYRDNAPQFPPA
jgi:hypothetical protein